MDTDDAPVFRNLLFMPCFPLSFGPVMLASHLDEKIFQLGFRTSRDIGLSFLVRGSVQYSGYFGAPFPDCDRSYVGCECDSELGH